jgi:hypothetical protein
MIPESSNSSGSTPITSASWLLTAINQSPNSQWTTLSGSQVSFYASNNTSTVTSTAVPGTPVICGVTGDPPVATYCPGLTTYNNTINLNSSSNSSAVSLTGCKSATTCSSVPSTPVMGVLLGRTWWAGASSATSYVPPSPPPEPPPPPTTPTCPPPYVSDGSGCILGPIIPY